MLPSNSETTIIQENPATEVIQLPTVGRIVHFYPNDWAKENIFPGSLNGATFLPAIITQSFGGTTANLAVITPFYGIVGQGSIPHKTDTAETNSYWVWPPRS